MATFYILQSQSIDKFFVGSSTDFPMQLRQHQKGHFPKGFKTEATDWETFFLIEDIPLDTANRLVKHAKKMKDKDYYQRLKDEPGLKGKLMQEFSTHRNR